MEHDRLFPGAGGFAVVSVLVDLVAAAVVPVLEIYNFPTNYNYLGTSMKLN